MDEADIFSDDELDHLPDNTLLELERNAISSTQKQPPRQLQQSLRPKQAHNASSLTRSKSVNNNIPWRPPQRVTQIAQASQEVPGPSSEHPSFEDEDVINLADDLPVPEWSQTQKSVQRRVPIYPRQKTIDAETAAAFAAADEELGVKSLYNNAAVTSNVETEAQIAALQDELEALRQEKLDIQRQLELRAGEIGIVRANADREKKEHEKRIQMLQRGYADEAAKHKAEVEAGRKEREKMQTDNRFLQHDLAQETERVRKLNGPKRVERDTPRKTRKTGLGDGFDDDEVRTYSPSRSREKRDMAARDLTPRAAKRKRSAQDSPVHPLVFAKPSPIPREDSLDSVQTAPPSAPAIQPIPNDDEADSIVFMQQLFEYQPAFADTRALEILAMHRVEDKPISTILMQALAMPKMTDETMPLQTIRAMGELWEICLEEQDFTSLRVIIDMVHFAVRQELPSRVSSLAEGLVPLCLRTLEYVTMPIVRAHLKASYGPGGEVIDETTKLIDADQITELLYDTCEACALSSERITKFWKMVDFTSSMLLLHKALPMHRVMIGLRILLTSVLPDSFGAMHEDSVGQEQQEKDTVYRLTFALFDIPAVPTGEPSYDEVETAEFRILVLDIITKLCSSDHGSLLLARHPHFIGRLVRFLDEQIRKLYTLPPSDHVPDNAHDLVVKTINMGMRVLHFLLHEHGDHIDLSEKFAVVTGGYHKFLIGMTRLAFIEPPTVFEHGIAEDVIDAAHSILDAFLTPEDGEAVAQALETPQGSKSVRAQSHVDDDVMMID